ncbi:MAG TPA: ABC transporter permease subunit [Ferrovibrio sp.]|jgi:NitT/TauT family transport system permease protein|uniref:ABC transporter permease n=1 Tax=Ferrovibrio sp. TaxID=1917215 RepID=UPI002B4ACE7A|nr:ABC transporter permease subunit [Ferrovibrio sp.]HLT76347.1 ABC transporter permease subunit [Ferrovibrio sp.]
MTRVLADRLGRLGRFLWAGWSGVAGIALFAALWQAGNERYGDFILPAPIDVSVAAWTILRDTGNWATAGLTILRGFEGFGLSVAIGMIGGLAAGYSPATMRLSRPILTLLIGVPPIAWIVLAMIWFGSTDATVIVTVAVAVTPMIFISSAEGAMTRDRGLEDMARAFGVGPFGRLRSIGLRHVASYLFPILSVSIGSAIKVAVMAELLSNVGGIGGALAMSRATLDVGAALAWILLAVTGVITIEYLLLRPIQAELERWRDAARPWGMKR